MPSVFNFSCEFWCHPALLQSVVLVYDEVESEGKPTPTPGSDLWISDTSHYRPELMRRVVSMWSTRTELPQNEFPWCENHVVRCWVTFRKSGGNHNSIREELGLETALNETA